MNHTQQLETDLMKSMTKCTNMALHSFVSLKYCRDYCPKYKGCPAIGKIVAVTE